MFDILKYYISFLTPDQLIDFNRLRLFMIDNNVIGTCVGVVIAYAAWDLVRSVVGDIVIPSIYYLFYILIVQNFLFLTYYFEPMNTFNPRNFLKEFVSFIIIVFITFFVIQYIVKNWVYNSDIAQSANTGSSIEKVEGSSSHNNSSIPFMVTSSNSVINTPYDVSRTSATYRK